MMRPLIGITTDYADGKQTLDHTYVQAVERAGGLPVILPTLKTADAAHQLTAMLHGLIIPGGDGITRGIVGELPHDLTPTDPTRDISDALIYEAFGDKRPVLGICYGMQFINAMAGGTLYGDLSAHLGGTLSHSPKRGGEPHAVKLEAGTYLARIFTETADFTANTYHLQSLARVGDGLRVNAAAPDGVIEGIESANGRVIGVQFHPERMGETAAPLFADFVARCAVHMTV